MMIFWKKILHSVSMQILYWWQVF